MSNNIRIVVAVNQASPELLSELSGVPARLRAERMRMLATLGLAVAGGVHATANPVRGLSDRAKKVTANKDRLAVGFARALGADDV